MKLRPKKVISMTLFLFVCTIIISCAKDTDLLLASVINDPEISLEESESITEESTAEEQEDVLVTRTFTFSPTSDAYLQNEEGHDDSIIRLQEDVRTSYLKFDLSQINGTITDAVLQFSVYSDEGDGSILIYKGESTLWTEENLNINNAPDVEIQLGSMNKSYKIGDPEKVTLDSNEIKAEITTLVMSHSSGNDLAFASKEHPDNIGPKLVIVYETTEDATLIEQEENDSSTETSTEQETATITEIVQIETPNLVTNSIAGAYYVTTSGSASANGLSENTAWSIEHAFESAVAGDIVYIKAGDYGAKNLNVNNSGTADKPIKFIGYTNIPGDIVSTEGSTFEYGDSINPNKMPLISGSAPNNEGEGTGIILTENYVTIENFQITKFKSGIRSNGNYITLKNLIVTKMGDFNTAHSYPLGTSDKFLNYSGTGIVFSGSNSKLINSFVLNCGAQAITFNNSDNIEARDNSVYSDNTINPTDYYFLIAANTTNSKFYNTTVHRVGELSHNGHGIVLKGNGDITNNLIDGFNIRNTFLELQFPKTSNNIAKNGTIIKDSDVNEDVDTVGGLKVANGSHHNSFQNIVLTNCSILFMDWDDGLAGDVDDVSDNNTFENITVQDAHSGIDFSFYNTSNLASSADNNSFINCTFKNLEYLFERDRANSGTILNNCTIENVNQFALRRLKDGTDYAINANYQNCTWSNNGFNISN